MEQKLGRIPTNEELGDQIGVSSNKVDWMMQVSWLPLSLESPINDEDDSELGMFVEDEITPTPMQSAYTNLLREKIEEVLSSLPRGKPAFYVCDSDWTMVEPIHWKKLGKSSV